MSDTARPMFDDYTNDLILLPYPLLLTKISSEGIDSEEACVYQRNNNHSFFFRG